MDNLLLLLLVFLTMVVFRLIKTPSESFMRSAARRARQAVQRAQQAAQQAAYKQQQYNMCVNNCQAIRNS